MKYTREHKKWTMKEVAELKKIYSRMHTEEIAKKLNRTYGSIAVKATSLGLKKDLDYLRKRKMEKEIYAMYRGDDLLVVGTLQEIADHQNMTVGNVRFMTYPSYHKRSAGRNRRLVYKLEEWENEIFRVWRIGCVEWIWDR